MRFLQRTRRKKEKCVRGSQKAGWAGCLLMESNKGQRLFLPVCDSQTMGQLPSTPQTHWQASHLGPHLTTDKTNSYSTPLPRLHSLARLPVGVERPMARLSRNHEVSFFSLLHLTMMNVAGANCTTPLCRLLPTWSSLDCVILDIFPAFKPPPPPPPCSARGLIWCRCTFSLSEAVQTGFFIYLFSFWLEHFLSLFLFILCSSDFRFICTGFSFFLSPLFGYPLLWDASTWATRKAENFAGSSASGKGNSRFLFFMEQQASDMCHPSTQWGGKGDAALQEVECD